MERESETVKSVKSTVWQLDKFRCRSYDPETLKDLPEKIKISQQIKMRVKLSGDGWKQSRIGIFGRKLRSTLFALDNIECLIISQNSPDIILRVYKLEVGTDGYRYGFEAYRFRHINRVDQFREMFKELGRNVVEHTSEAPISVVQREINGQLEEVETINAVSSVSLPNIRPVDNRQNNEADSTDMEVENNEDARSIGHYFDDAIDGSRQKLSQKIYLSEGLLSILRDKKVLTDEQIDDIKAQKVDDERIARMLDLLKKRPNSCFDDFIRALHATSQGHIADFLIDSLKGSTKRRDSKITMNSADKQRGRSKTSIDRQSNSGVHGSTSFSNTGGLSRGITRSLPSLIDLSQNNSKSKTSKSSMRLEDIGECDNHKLSWSRRCSKISVSPCTF